MTLRGILLAGGKGTRLGDLTKVTNKHLLPIGPYPMIYYPIKKLVGAGITEILLISGAEYMGDFIKLLGSGRELGCSLTYRVQDEPGGVAQAVGLGELFAGNGRCVVLLGDNIFHAPLGPIVEAAAKHPEDAFVVLKQVADARPYGVAEMRGGRIVALEEKPVAPTSDLAVVGIYLYPPDVFSIIRDVKPSVRGEREITDVNTRYLHEGRLRYLNLEGYWTDAGTLESLELANSLISQAMPMWA